MTGSNSRKSAHVAPCGTFSSSTMIVIMIAITPSLNASNRPLLIKIYFFAFTGFFFLGGNAANTSSKIAGNWVSAVICSSVMT